jgi:hypothetical protein
LFTELPTFPLVPPWTLLGYSQGNECITSTGTVSIASGIQVVIENILCERTQCHLKLVKALGMCLITSHVNHQLKHGIVVGNDVKMQKSKCNWDVSNLYRIPFGTYMHVDICKKN